MASALLTWEGLVQKHFHDNVEAQTVMFFLCVAAKSEPVDLTSVANSLKMTKAASSRNFYRLSKGLRNGADGLDLIEAFDDPSDYRRKLLKLSSKGEEVADDLCQYLFDSVRRIENAQAE